MNQASVALTDVILTKYCCRTGYGFVHPIMVLQCITVAQANLMIPKRREGNLRNALEGYRLKRFYGLQNNGSRNVLVAKRY